jgi:HlyD family secretion protein
MQTRTKVIIGIAVVVVLGAAAALSVRRGRDRGTEVRIEALERRDLVQTVTASGNIRARSTADISAEISAKVAELLVEEGDDVLAGQVLLRLEPDQYDASVARTEASLAQSEAQQAQQQASLIRSQRTLDRLLQLSARDSLLVSPVQIDDARTDVEVAEAMLESARHGVSQARAQLEEARELLSKTVLTAPNAGKVTRLNVEEGETVMVGTMNNPGSLILTVSDLSIMEVVVQVDETDVPAISLGDSATIRIDAFPDREFAGRVTEIGNSAINPPDQQAAGQQAAIDFEVVLTLSESKVQLRPDLSATADVVVETRDDVLAVPIIALTVRDENADSVEGDGPNGDVNDGDVGDSDVEGVFLVADGVVTFTPVEIGIAGQEYFELLSGLAVGDRIVAGPYQRIRQLRTGDEVRESEGPVIDGSQ